MKVALYARVSTKDKNQNPEMQLEPLRQYCGTMGWDHTEYMDQASAADFNSRADWKRLLHDASQHKFDILLVWKLDRAFRSMVDASNTLAMLNSYHVGFRSLMDASIDTTTPNGMLVFNILASVAQFEKDLIVMRVNEGLTYAKRHGTKSGRPIGRKGYDIPLANICKALVDGKGVVSEAARILSVQYGKKISPGFVSSRIKRSGLAWEDISGGGSDDGR